MKNILLFLLISCFGNFINAQNCYFPKSNLTGIDHSLDSSLFELAASELRNAFPTDFQSKFKVFDYGYYSNNKFVEGGFQKTWDEKIIPEVEALSTYYLAFCRQAPDNNGKSKIWVKIKLPETSWLSLCFGDSYIQVQKTSIIKLFDFANAPYSNVDQLLIDAIKNMKTRIQELSVCCQPDENMRFRSTTCEGCVSAVDVYDELINLGFMSHFPCTVLDSATNQDCLSLEATTIRSRSKNKNGNRTSTAIIDSANYLLKIDDVQYDLYNILNDVITDIPNFKAIISKNVNFIADGNFANFETIYNQNENVAWIHIWENPINDMDDVLMIKYKLSVGNILQPSFNAYEPTTVPNQPDFKYTITQRSFAPWDRFGHLPYIHAAKNSFHGDNRGFSLDKSTVLLGNTEGASARLHQFIEFNLKGKKIIGDNFSSITRGYRNFIRKISATHMTPEKILSEVNDVQDPSGVEEIQKNGHNNRIKLFVEGSDPLVSLLFAGVTWLTPDIECLLYSNCYYQEEESALYYHGSLFYKEFPAYEAFIEDNCGNKLFLHTMTAPNESELVGELVNPIWDYQRFFDFKIPVDVAGCFLESIIPLDINRQTNIITEGQSITITDWNNTNLNKPPALDCLTIPCQGVYPNN